jgi:hypothetical protein
LGTISRMLTGTVDHAYASGYVAIDRFSSVARSPDVGGPLGQVGILYEALGIGRYGTALDDRPADDVGGAIGYQKFYADYRRQIVLEIGGTTDTNDGGDRAAIALGGRFQQAFGRHLVAQLDGFVAGQRERGPGYGGRAEMAVTF